MLLQLGARKWTQSPRSARREPSSKSDTGHPIRDAEWESTKARLVEFARVLRGWHQQRMAAVHPVAEGIATSQALPKAA